MATLEKINIVIVDSALSDFQCYSVKSLVFVDILLGWRVVEAPCKLIRSRPLRLPIQGQTHSLHHPSYNKLATKVSTPDYEKATVCKSIRVSLVQFN